MSDVGGLALDGTVHELDPKIRIVWAIGSSVPWLVLGIIGAVVAVVTGHAPLAALAAVVSIVVAGVGVSVVGWRFRSWRWSAWDDALELQHGVLSRRASVVPYHRIQQIDIHRDPIDRLLGLSKLILRTAAATSDAVLPGIAARHADELRHALLHRSGQDDAV
jgi:membrane protein YdbS with pleckstrin-like domain